MLNVVKGVLAPMTGTMLSELTVKIVVAIAFVCGPTADALTLPVVNDPFGVIVTESTEDAAEPEAELVFV